MSDAAWPARAVIIAHGALARAGATAGQWLTFEVVVGGPLGFSNDQHGVQNDWPRENVQPAFHALAGYLERRTRIPSPGNGGWVPFIHVMVLRIPSTTARAGKGNTTVRRRHTTPFPFQTASLFFSVGFCNYHHRWLHHRLSESRILLWGSLGHVTACLQVWGH